MLAASIFHYGEHTIGAGEGGDAGGGHRECRRSSVRDGRILDDVRWNADGLVPAVAQDAGPAGAVLTLGWMNRAALSANR